LGVVGYSYPLIHSRSGEMADAQDLKIHFSPFYPIAYQRFP
jgi:hypothetical protein